MNSKTIAIAIVVAVVIIAAAAVVVITSNGDEDEPSNFVVSFDSNGGNGEMADLESELGTPIEVPACGFDNKSNFKVFVSWNTEKDGSGKEYLPSSTISSDVEGTQTLYAQWKPIKVSDLGVGSVMKYEITGGCDVYGIPFQYSGEMTESYNSVSGTTKTVEQTQDLTASYVDDKGNTQKDTQKNTITYTIDASKQNTGTPSKTTTAWGVKDTICVEFDKADAYGNMFHYVEYHDAESYVLYQQTISADAYLTGGTVLNNYSLVYTLVDYTAVVN